MFWSSLIYVQGNEPQRQHRLQDMTTAMKIIQQPTAALLRKLDTPIFTQSTLLRSSAKQASESIYCKYSACFINDALVSMHSTNLLEEPYSFSSSTLMGCFHAVYPLSPVIQSQLISLFCFLLISTRV